MSAEDYSLIQGFPGTGKTATIVFLTRLMIAKGKRVLVTSYTHTAVDNIIIKLVENCHYRDLRVQGPNTDVIRIGPKHACHPSLHSILVSEVAGAIDDRDGQHLDTSSVENDRNPSMSSLHRVVDSVKIVGVTALAIPKNPLLVGQKYDLVIVDEAGQMNQPACIGAILAADSFLLVGDHEQLPPLARSDAAEQAGMGVSMLKRLSDKHPQCVAQLTLQYRMNEEICEVANQLVYRGKLKCANECIRSRRLKLPYFPHAIRRILKSSNSGLGWLLPVLNPIKPVVFISTDKIRRISPEIGGLEELTGKRGTGGGFVNNVEVILTSHIIHGLSICGLSFSEIGVISPFRAQVRSLEEDFFVHSSKLKGLELSTIDKYQGRDKNVIIVSTVRSNKYRKVGRILEDRRRLNVALTRAKMKLIIIGSYDTLTKGSSVFSDTLGFMNRKGWVEVLPFNPDSYNIPSRS